MRRLALLLIVLPLLAGCDRYSGGPLPHALAALRAGDYDDFLTAKKESDEEIKGAIQPSDDLCLTSPKDFTKYGVQYAINLLNHKGLFALPEEDRFVYAVKVAGKTKKLCESCADEVREQGEVAEASEAVVQNMMGFKGRR